MGCARAVGSRAVQPPAFHRGADAHLRIVRPCRPPRRDSCSFMRMSLKQRKRPMGRGKAITALVTGVGDTVGQALIKALRESAVPCRLIGTDRDKLSVGLEWVDRSYLLPHCSRAEAYLRELATICADEKVRLIFPGSENELELLASQSEALRSEAGAMV